MLDEREIEAVAAAMRSGWITTGPLTHKFEEKFAALVGARHAVAVASGTAALHVALRVANVHEGDEVITTPYTFIAVSEAILYLRAKPVFVDIDPVTLNLDPEAVAEAVTSKTKALLPVHMAGYPCEMSPLLALAERDGLAIIEDAAHALPSEYDGRRIGSIGTLTAFSFYATKNLTTGEGGMVTTNDEALAERIRVLRLHGISGDAWKRYRKGGRWYYEVVDNGYKYNLGDIQSAMGLEQLEKLDQMDRIRRAHDQQYREALADCPVILPPTEDAKHRSALHLFIVRLDTERTSWSREAFIEALQAERIFPSVHFIPIHLHPFYEKMGYRRGMYPEAERAYDQAVSLPFYPAMPEASVERLLQTVRRLLMKEQR